MATSMLTQFPGDRVPDRCESVLRQNWREGTRTSDGTPFAYTCPRPGRYPWQWFWDSRFHAAPDGQPPLLAWAWRIAVGDPAREPRIARPMGWLKEHRDLEGDGRL